MLKRLSLTILVLLFILPGCAAAIGNSAPAEAPVADMERAAVYEEQDFADESVSSGSPGYASSVDRIVLRDASLTIVVEDPGQAMSTISRMAETMGGFVVSSNLYKSYTGSGIEVPEASITVRVPAESLTEALDQIKGLVEDPSKDINSESVNGRDVTLEYTDLNSRLRNLEETEARLREIMASAVKTEDVLAVNAQLTQIREQIEVLKGQINYYDEAAALSSISIQIKAQASVQPIEIGGWKPVGVARDALQALIDTMQFLGTAAIWLVIFLLPVGLVIFLPLRFLWQLIRRGRKNRRNQAQSASPPTIPPAMNSQ